MIKLYQTSLRNKFTYTLGAFGFFVAIIVGLFGIYLNERLELEVWRSTLESEYFNYINNYKNSNEGNVVEYGNLKIYKVDKATLMDSALPAELVKLAPGVHDEVKIKKSDYSVLVRDLKNQRVFLVYDISFLEKTEFGLSVLFIGVLSLFFIIILYLSHMLGGYLVSPIKRIAGVVSTLNPEVRGLRVGDDYKEDELSVIANAIDSYLIKMDEFVNSEKEFIDMASHELRTPIAIISGAVDVLNAHPESVKISERALSRIKQSTKDIAELINVLFLLSKDESQIKNTAENFNLDELVDKVVSDHVSVFPEKKVKINLKLEKTHFFSPKESTVIVLNNLVRNAIEHAKSHEISITLKNGVLSIENQGDYLDPEQVALLYNKHVRGDGDGDGKGNGVGLGLYLINRICESFNWKLDITSHTDNKFIARLDFSNSLVSGDKTK